MVGAVEDADGSSVLLAGRTGGDWAVVNAGGSDFAAVKICADDGSELWRFQVCSKRFKEGRLNLRLDMWRSQVCQWLKVESKLR